MQLSKKTFIVTGAGSGIGQQLTLQLLQRGADVAGVDINPDALLQTERLSGVSHNRFRWYALDIANREQVERLPQEVVAHFGVVDGLINNAGIIQQFKAILDLSMQEIEHVMNVNFYGTLNMTKAFLPLFLKRPQAHIINISSMGGFLPVPGQVLYGAAKAAVKLFTEGLYAELADTNVLVTVVFPGAVATNISENSGLETPKASAGSAKLKPLPAHKAAEIILNGIQGNEFRVFVGNDSRLLDWLYRLNPEFAVGLIQKKMKSLRPAT